MIDNAANYVIAGRLLEKDFSKLYWSPCVAHCINWMVQDFGKFEEVSEIVHMPKKLLSTYIIIVIHYSL